MQLLAGGGVPLSTLCPSSPPGPLETASAPRPFPIPLQPLDIPLRPAAPSNHPNPVQLSFLCARLPSLLQSEWRPSLARLPRELLVELLGSEELVVESVGLRPHHDPVHETIS
jgi:hypothetical protein